MFSSFFILLIGPLFSTVHLVIAIYAQRRSRNKGSNLMVAGGLLGLFGAIFDSFLSYALNYDSAVRIEHDEFMTLLPYATIIGVVAGLLFFGGLFLYIRTITEKITDWKVLDRMD